MRKELHVLTTAMLIIPYVSSAFGQGFCDYPTGEYVGNTSDDTTGTSIAASNFYMALVGGSGSFGGAAVDEYAPEDAGTNGCYTPNVNPALDPEHPKISGGHWTIAGGYTYEPDVVGWATASVDYIRVNSYLGSPTPIIDLPCGAEIHQTLSITCPQDPSAPPYIYVPSQDLTASVYSDYVTNCRAGTCRQEHY